MNNTSYDEYLEKDGFPHFWIQWRRGDEAKPIDLSVIDYSNFHLNRYLALRDYLIDRLHEYGGYSDKRTIYFSGCTKTYKMKGFWQRLRYVLFGCSTEVDSDG